MRPAVSWADADIKDAKAREARSGSKIKFFIIMGKCLSQRLLETKKLNRSHFPDFSTD